MHRENRGLSKKKKGVICCLALAAGALLRPRLRVMTVLVSLDVARTRLNPAPSLFIHVQVRPRSAAVEEIVRESKEEASPTAWEVGVLWVLQHPLPLLPVLFDCKGN